MSIPGGENTYGSTLAFWIESPVSSMIWRFVLAESSASFGEGELPAASRAGVGFGDEDITRWRKSAPSTIGNLPQRVIGSMPLKDLNAPTRAEESIILQL